MIYNPPLDRISPDAAGACRAPNRRQFFCDKVFVNQCPTFGSDSVLMQRERHEGARRRAPPNRPKQVDVDRRNLAFERALNLVMFPRSGHWTTVYHTAVRPDWTTTMPCRRMPTYGRQHAVNSRGGMGGGFALTQHSMEALDTSRARDSAEKR